MGANFCQVAIIMAVFSVEPCNTSGSQKCTGASPSFIAIAMVRRTFAVGFGEFMISQVPISHAFVVLENRIIAEAAACVKKYFVAASVARGWCCFEIIGMMARVFISSPIQAINQW